MADGRRVSSQLTPSEAQYDARTSVDHRGTLERVLQNTVAFDDRTLCVR